MNAIQYVNKVMGVKLSFYQQELLKLVETNPNGYLGDVLRKNPSFAVKQVAELYDQYEQRTMVQV